MSTLETHPDLARLGDQLEAAAERSLVTGRRRRIGRATLAVVVLTVLAAGTAIATGVFTPRQVAAGLPAGTLMFGGTHPTAPSTATASRTTAPSPRAPSDGGISDFRGSKQLIAVDQKIAGGCIGQDEAGLSWDCYVGAEAVRHEILTEDLLGQPELDRPRADPEPFRRDEKRWPSGHRFFMLGSDRPLTADSEGEVSDGDGGGRPERRHGSGRPSSRRDFASTSYRSGRTSGRAACSRGRR